MSKPDRTHTLRLLVAWAVRLSGDPAVMLAQGAGSISEQDLANIRAALGLNRPFSAQYAGFVAGMVAQALPLTLLLAFLPLAVSLLLSIPRACTRRCSAAAGRTRRSASSP